MRKTIASAKRQPLSNLRSVASGSDAEPGAIIVLYQREEYQTYVRDALQLIHPQPRGWYRGIMPLRRNSGRSGILYVVDRRRAAEFLESNERLVPAPGMQSVAAPPGVSCDGLCGSRGLRCDAGQLEFVNNCEALQQAFPCEAGCGHQVGIEIPCYVHVAGRDTEHQCLITDEEVSRCAAAYASTSRLCACV